MSIFGIRESKNSEMEFRVFSRTVEDRTVTDVSFGRRTDKQILDTKLIIYLLSCRSSREMVQKIVILHIFNFDRRISTGSLTHTGISRILIFSFSSLVLNSQY